MGTRVRRSPGVAFPGDSAYTSATAVFNLTAPAHPAAAVTARSVEDVQKALAYAADAGLPVRVHTTGHASAAVRPMDGTLLIRTDLGGHVEVDPGRRLARIPAGATWGQVVAATTPHGLTAAHGSSALVGAVGFLLGGGVSFYGRKVGLAVNSVRAVDLVTADGERHRVDATTAPDLFWALRGGGGGFGVVTAVEVDLFPVAGVVTGAAYWSAAHASRVLDLWRAWTRNAPDEASTSLRILNFPPDPNLPPALRSGPLVAVDGAFIADRDAALQQAHDLLGPLRAVAEPVLDTWQAMPPEAVLEAHLDAPEPMPFIGDHFLLSDLTDEAAHVFLRETGEGSPLVLSGFRQLGGAFARPVKDGGALNHVAARYAYMGSGAPIGPVTTAALHEHCTKVRAALSPWNAGQTIPSLVESADRPQRHLDADTARRVQRIRDEVDPQGRFQGDISPGAVHPG